MEITMEMIEQVLDATGTDYYTAKQALIEHDGNVEETIKEVLEKEAAKKTDDASSAAANEAEDIRESTPGQEADDETKNVEELFEEVFSDEYADNMVNRLKDRVKAGNVDRIRISREGKTIIDVPVNVGMIGGLFGLITVPWALILGVITAYGLNCKIEIITSDGKTEDM